MLTFRQLQSEQEEWSKHNFKERSAERAFEGLVEEYFELVDAIAEIDGNPRPPEDGKTYKSDYSSSQQIKRVAYDPDPIRGIGVAIGRIAHGLLKKSQGIRGNEEDHLENVRDAVGDVIIYLADFCNRMGFDFQDIMETTWAEVKERNWVQFPLDGKNPTPKEMMPPDTTLR